MKYGRLDPSSVNIEDQRRRVSEHFLSFLLDSPILNKVQEDKGDEEEWQDLQKTINHINVLAERGNYPSSAQDLLLQGNRGLKRSILEKAYWDLITRNNKRTRSLREAREINKF